MVLTAQSGFDIFLNLVKENNAQLLAAKHEMLALQDEAKVGLTPANPKVRYGYMPGNNATPGNKTIWGIEQSFDFPTVYSTQKALSRNKIDLIELNYQKTKQDILLDAAMRYCEWVFLLKKEKEYKNRLVNALKLLNSYNSKLANGNTTILEANKAKILYLSMKSQYEFIKQDLSQVISQIQLMTNQSNIDLPDTNYFMNYIPGFEEIKTEYSAKSPDMALIKSNERVIASQNKLLKQAALPELSIGYESENETEGSFAGPTIGLELPLWQDKNKKKLAKAKTISAQTAMLAQEQFLFSNLELAYSKTKSLQNIILDFQETLNNDADLRFIEKAFESGQISIIDYINEISFYYDIKDLELETERDFYISQVKLFSYKP